MRIGPLLGGARSSAAALVGLGDLHRVQVLRAPRALQFLWRGPVAAMTVRDRVYVDPRLFDAETDELATLLLHELVHVRQWRDAGPRRFLTRYVGDYLRGRLAGRTHDESYRGIRYEVEARR
ncbi:MAG: DUF4157 domain-containing protein, partial [Acidimicrobiia bacterium]